MKALLIISKMQTPEKFLAIESNIIEQGYLEADDIHRVYYVWIGDKSLPPIITIHGGPGGHCKPSHLARYDRSRFSLVMFDQRGCGLSTPAGELRQNTTQDLINDIENIRRKLGIKKFYAAGSSWGSTLALVYAQAYPENVLGLMLQNVFLARRTDIDWLLTEQGVARYFPDLWAERIEFLKQKKIDPQQPAKQLLEILQQGNTKEKLEVVRMFVNWEGNMAFNYLPVKQFSAEDFNEEDIASTKIFLHYEINDFFLEENQIFQHMDKIKHIKTGILHGRHDLISPPEQAILLHSEFENSTLEILPGQGHKFIPSAGQLTKYFFSALFT